MRPTRDATACTFLGETQQAGVDLSGQDNVALLKEAGFDEAAIAKLRSLGVIAPERATALPEGADVGHAGP